MNSENKMQNQSFKVKGIFSQCKEPFFEAISRKFGRSDDEKQNFWCRPQSKR